MLLVAASHSYMWRKVHVISCILEIPGPINEVHEKILFAGLESGFVNTSVVKAFCTPVSGQGGPYGP